ncbi:hypothetical protein [Clavibacter phaseoli]|uniref:hypothetical protein n=1 Tax=Clavibacter phaseoli TaxID=1734031 RepID=UPI001E4E5A62|nr:hypothetical protein [Clavibacter phaseoli]
MAVHAEDTAAIRTGQMPCGAVAPWAPGTKVASAEAACVRRSTRQWAAVAMASPSGVATTLAVQARSRPPST